MCNSTALSALELGEEITQLMCNFRGFGQLLAICLGSTQLACASGAGRSGRACSDNSRAMDLDAILSVCVTPNPGCAPGPHSFSRLAQVRDSLSALAIQPQDVMLVKIYYILTSMAQSACAWQHESFRETSGSSWTKRRIDPAGEPALTSLAARRPRSGYLRHFLVFSRRTLVNACTSALMTAGDVRHPAIPT